MKSIAFRIKGNHKKKTGNALPKLKMTGRQAWTPKAREYVEWKTHVVVHFLATQKDSSNGERVAIMRAAMRKKPIALVKGEHAFMILRVNWENNMHGDPENIFGSIADALFENDKNLDVMTLSQINPLGKGEVAGVIWVFDDQATKVAFIEEMLKNDIK